MNKNTLFLLGEKTPTMLKISELLEKAELSFEWATFNGKPITNETRLNIDKISDLSKDSVVYVNCSEEVPSFEYATYIGEYKDGNLMEQFLNLLYLNEMFKAGLIKYTPGSQSKTLGRVINASILIEGKKEWLIDYMDFCGVSPIPEDVVQYLR